MNTTVEDVKQYFEQFGKVGLHRGAVLGLGKHQRTDQARLGVTVRSPQFLQQAKEGLNLPQVRADLVTVWAPRSIYGLQTLGLSGERKPPSRVSLITLPLYFSPASLESPKGGGAPVASSIQSSP